MYITIHVCPLQYVYRPIPKGNTLYIRKYTNITLTVYEEAYIHIFVWSLLVWILSRHVYDIAFPGKPGLHIKPEMITWGCTVQKFGAGSSPGYDRTWTFGRNNEQWQVFKTVNKCKIHYFYQCRSTVCLSVHLITPYRLLGWLALLF